MEPEPDNDQEPPGLSGRDALIVAIVLLVPFAAMWAHWIELGAAIASVTVATISMALYVAYRHNGVTGVMAVIGALAFAAAMFGYCCASLSNI